MISFNLPEEKSSIIKVIGVGGGGSNAVNHMYSQGIEGVNYVICNTDNQALEMSEVPNKIQLGANLRGGLGAGNKPEIGREATEEAIDQIEELLQTNTKMVFITAGMGGGTGTGGAPVIARLAKDMGILTVGIVTTPFGFEGVKRKRSATSGIEELKKEVDALLVISNDKLIDIFGNLKVSQAFAQADGILTTAAKGIAEIITKTGYINVDFEDVNTVMRDSGVALMGVGNAEGEDRAIQAIEGAMNSPLLNDNNIVGAKSVLLNIGYGSEEPDMQEIKVITNYIEEAVGVSEESETLIWGLSEDASLGEGLSITLIATGFESKVDRKKREEQKNIILPLGNVKGSEKATQISFEFDNSQANNVNSNEVTTYELTQTEELPSDSVSNAQAITESFTLHTLDGNDEFQNESESFNDVKEVNEEDSKIVVREERFVEIPSDDQKGDDSLKKDEIPSGLPETLDERLARLKSFGVRRTTPQEIEALERVPAYKRKGTFTAEEEESYNDETSSYSLGKSSTSDDFEIKGNSYLHNNAD